MTLLPVRSFRILVIGIICTFLCRAAVNAPHSTAIPLFFFPNTGQAPADVKFVARTPNISAYFGSGETTFHLQKHTVRVEFLGANKEAKIAVENPTGASVNFLNGADQSAWRTAIPAYGKVSYTGLYQGIDMSYGGTDRKLKSEFSVAPGADPGQIRLWYQGAKHISVGKDGALNLDMGDGVLSEEKPVVYQETDGVRQAVKAAYKILPGDVVGFDIGPYDSSRALVIDPTLYYSTYLSGSGFETATGVAVDAAGNAYVCGYTDSLDFPLRGAIRSTNAGSVDAFVVKLNPAGDQLLFATYLGGQGDDRALGIAVDPGNNVVIVGYTTSTDFPILNPYQASLAGGKDAFLTKLNNTGSQIVFSTFFGGSGNDSANAVFVDANGNDYVAGETTSINFKLKNAFQATNKGRSDGFVSKWSYGSALISSTYVGGSNDDRVLGVAADSSGSMYITGVTSSTNFPTVSPLQGSLRGGQDAFVAKVSGSGNSLLYSTYLGGSSGSTTLPEAGKGIAVDSSGNAYVTGVTSSTNFPTFGPFQTAFGGGGTDAFVSKLNATGTSLLYSSFLGGFGMDTGTAITLDAAGNAYVTGNTIASTFPLVNAIQSTIGGANDAFLVAVNPTGSALTFSSYVGGLGADSGNAIAINSAGTVWIAGQTTSTDFPTLNAYQTTGFEDGSGFVTSIAFGTVVQANRPPTNGPSATPASSTAVRQAFTVVPNDPDGYQDITMVIFLVNTAATSPNNSCQAYYLKSTNSFYMISDTGTSLGPLAPGSAGNLQSSQCTLYGANSAVSGSGNNLTITVDLEVKPSYHGSNKLYLITRDSQNHAIGWEQKATWFVP